MVPNNIVFILGAGAHCSYGFPSGEDLKKEIISVAQNSLSQNGTNSLLKLVPLGEASTNEISALRCKEFVEALSRAAQPSIDAFLNANKHKDGFEKIAKCAIAQVLLRYEKLNRPSSKDDWLKYVFEIMLDGISTIQDFTTKNKNQFCYLQLRQIFGGLATRENKVLFWHR